MPKKKHPVEEEIVFEEGDSEAIDDLADAEETAAGKLAKLREKLKDCQKERQEFLDGWQRQKADFLNAKRRMEEERASDVVRTTASVIEKLIPLADSFDVALREGPAGDGAGWRDGVERMRAQLFSTLEGLGVSALEPVGGAFDPRFHEAVSEVPVTDPAQHHVVLEVFSRGYALGERVIRPAKVVVGRFDA